MVPGREGRETSAREDHPVGFTVNDIKTNEFESLIAVYL